MPIVKIKQTRIKDGTIPEGRNGREDRKNKMYG